MSAQHLDRIATRVAGAPLMVTQAKLNVILNVLAPRLGIEAPAVDAAALDRQAEGRRYEIEDGVAIVPVHGTLLHRRDGLAAASGLMAYGEIGDMVATAVADPEVRHVVLDVDSPGGEVAGVFDQVDRIAAMRGTKPITAVVNEEANSAAYAIASAADRIVNTRTGIAGSIGVIATHIDRSARNADQGYVVTHIYAGDKKADYSPHRPLSDAAAQRLQGSVNKVFQIFVETVARNRAMSQDAVRRTEARVYTGTEAVAVGLADAIDTVEGVVEKAQTGQPIAGAAAMAGSWLPPAEGDTARPRSSFEQALSEASADRGVAREPEFIDQGRRS